MPCTLAMTGKVDTLCVGNGLCAVPKSTIIHCPFVELPARPCGFCKSKHFPILHKVIGADVVKVYKIKFMKLYKTQNFK